MTHVTCKMTAKNRDQLRNPTLGIRVWAPFTFFILYCQHTIPSTHTHTMCTRILGQETEEASKLCAIVSTRQTVGAHPFLAHARHDKTVVPACRPPPPRRRPGRQLRLAARPPTRSDVVRHAECKHAVDCCIWLNLNGFTKRHATRVIYMYRLTVQTLSDGLETQFTPPDTTQAALSCVWRAVWIGHSACPDFWPFDLKDNACLAYGYTSTTLVFQQYCSYIRAHLNKYYPTLAMDIW